MVEREAVLVGIDVGTSKVCALIGEVSRDGRLTIMGHGTVPASGLKKGVVINIDQTVRSIADAVERAERLSGWKIDRPSSASAASTSRASTRPARWRSPPTTARSPARTSTARSRSPAPCPSRRIARSSTSSAAGFTVDGQEGVKDPLGMSALRLEVETHIVTASATAVQNLTKCVSAAGVKIDELVADSLASARGRPVRDREGARRRGRRHRRRDHRPRPVPGGFAVPHPGPAGRRATTSPTTSRSGSRRASRSPRSSRSATARATCEPSRRATTRRSASRSSARTPAGRSAGSRSARSSRRACARRSSCCANEIRAAGRRDAARRASS